MDFLVSRRRKELIIWPCTSSKCVLCVHIPTCMCACRLIKEMYTIVPHVERLEDDRKCLKTTVQDACVVRACMCDWICENLT